MYNTHFFQTKSTTLFSNNRFRKNKFSAAKLSTLLLTSIFSLYSMVLPSQASSIEEDIASRKAMTIQSNEIENWPQGPTVSAEAAILMEVETGTILYAKNIDKHEFPASTTKILTCLIAAQTCSMDEMVTMSTTAIYDTPYSSSHIAMDVGESITMEQALNAILIASANEVAFGVAEHISGTWQDFAVLMNETATELGCLDSNFINPNGLPDDNHYTTAYDLATIGRAFFSNDLLCKISSSAQLHIPASATQPDDIVENSKNKLLPGKDYAYEGLLGSKTGYTDLARNCLVSGAERNGMKLVCVVFKDESPLQFEDTVSLFDYGFSNFDKVNISQAETKYNIENNGFSYSTNDIFGSSTPILSLNENDCIILPKTATFEDTESTISYNSTEEDQAALITYTYHDTFIGSVSVELTSSEEQTYAFDSENTVETDSTIAENNTVTENPSDNSILFISIERLFILIGIILFAILAIAVILFLLRNYHFTEKTRKRYKQRSNSYHFSQQMQESPHLKRRQSLSQTKKRRKHTSTFHQIKNRFRDYD